MKKNIASLQGQISIWDIEIISEENIAKVDKIEKQLKLTEEQQEFINENKIIENENLSRIILYCSNGLGIEVKSGNGFITTYVNKEGKEQFVLNKKSSVIPMDKILYYKRDVKANELQEEKLKDLKRKYKHIKEIRRNGDDNILVEVAEKVISINCLGWVLEFNNIKAIYSDEEVIKNSNKEIVDIESLQNSVKVGDTVEAIVGKDNRLVKGKITRMYGMGNAILNIVFDKNTKHTAIGRYAIRKIICA